MGGSSYRRRRDTDSGWAWLVMVASFVGVVIYCSTLFMGGVFYTALLRKYREGAAKTSLIGSLSHGGLCLLGPVAGAFINRFSCRAAIVIGGLLTTTGYVMSAFVPGLDWTVVTAGAIVGVGFSFSSAGLICSLGFYFERWRDQTMAAAFVLIGVAMLSSAPLGTFLLDSRGLSGTFLVVAAIQAQMCVAGVVCKPSSLEKEVHARRKVERKEKDTDRISQYLDVTLLRNFAFLLFLLSTSAWNFALCVALVHLPNYVTVLGGGDGEINMLMTIFAISNVIGRILGLLAVSRLKLKSLIITISVLFLSGVITTAFPYYSTMPGATYIFTAQLGASVGIPNSMMTPTAVKFVGVSKLSEAYGLSYVFCGFGATSGPVVAGYIYGRTGLYENSFLASGVVLLVGGVFGILSLCCGQTDERRQKIELAVDDGGKQTYSWRKPGDKDELQALTVARQVASVDPGYKDELQALTVDKQLASLDPGYKDELQALSVDKQLASLEPGYKDELQALTVDKQLASLEPGYKDELQALNVDKQLASLEPGYKDELQALTVDKQLASLEPGYKDELQALTGDRQLASLEPGYNDKLQALTVDKQLTSLESGYKDELQALTVDKQLASLEPGFKDELKAFNVDEQVASLEEPGHKDHLLALTDHDRTIVANKPP